MLFPCASHLDKVPSFILHILQMEGLIKIEKSQGGKQVVSARELYDFLELDKSNWTRWSKKNIEDNPFSRENEDWAGFVIKTNGNETKDFSITIDFAKRLAMMARTEKGEAARNYFIECEKKMNVLSMPNFNNPAEAARAWADEFEAKELAQLKAKNLTEALGRSMERASILRVAQCVGVHEKTFNWRRLKEHSTVLGHEIKKMPSTRYGYRNTYHIDVFKAAYPQFDYSVLKEAEDI